MCTITKVGVKGRSFTKANTHNPSQPYKCKYYAKKTTRLNLRECIFKATPIVYTVNTAARSKGEGAFSSVLLHTQSTTMSGTGSCLKGR